MQSENIRCNLDSTFEPIDEKAAFAFSEFFKMFADSSRIRILYLLKGREICVNHIAEKLGMTISAVSHQLRLLRTAGLVRFIREGKNSYYALDDDHIFDMLNLAQQHIDH